MAKQNKKLRARGVRVVLEGELYRRVALIAKRNGMTPAALVAQIVESHTPQQVCQKCGCTQYDGCEEGCSWVAFDLCSVCSSKRSAR